MRKPRRHERATLIADVTISPGQQQPAHFAANMFNVSPAGAAVFSNRDVPLGTLVCMEVSLPNGRESMLKAMLYGVIRRVRVQMEGNELGIEFVAGAADHNRFIDYLDRRQARFPTAGRAGFTLAETLVAVTIICILVTMAAPTYSRAIEQARVDGAAGNLTVIWSAQRIYWLEHKTFSADLTSLQAMDLVDQRLVNSASNPNARFVYSITSAGADTFTATALRAGSTSWTGQLVMDEGGQVTGAINGSGGQTLTPPS